MIYDNVLQAVGGTPLVRLQRMTGPEDAQVLVKFEGVNVGGSVKMRTALKMIEEALDCARRLAREEGLFCGISSGTNVVAVLRLAAKLGPGKTVVTLAPIPASATFPRRYCDCGRPEGRPYRELLL
jgi:cysteine synthase A